jgi:cytochrome b561
LENNKMAIRDTSINYGSVSRLNHWIGALFVLLLLGIGLYFEDLPRGDARRYWRGLHVSIGTIAVLFLLFRVFWRMRSTSPPALPQAQALKLFSKLVHWLLLAAILVMAVTGPLTIWSAGRPLAVFDLVSIPSPFGPFKSWHEPMQDIHGLTANTLIFLIGLHLLGVIKHQFIDRDNILARMTGRARGASDTATRCNDPWTAAPD